MVDRSKGPANNTLDVQTRAVGGGHLCSTQRTGCRRDANRCVWGVMVTKALP